MHAATPFDRFFWASTSLCFIIALSLDLLAHHMCRKKAAYDKAGAVGTVAAVIWACLGTTSLVVTLCGLEKAGLISVVWSYLAWSDWKRRSKMRDLMTRANR